LQSRAAESEAARDERIITNRDFGLAASVGRGLIRYSLDYAAGGVGAEGSGLRAAQNFDLLHVEQIANSAQAGEVKVIN